MAGTRWSDTRTRRGLPADQVISALQKEIRRSNCENGVLLAYEMVTTSEELEEYFWKRLMVISVEDIGLAAPEAPVLISSLYQMHLALQPGTPDRHLFAVHGVRFLCRCRKDRSSDEMALWIRLEADRGGAMPQIPDYALDMHTACGKSEGRDLRHFLNVGAVVAPEDPQRETTYRERITQLLVRDGETPRG